MTGYGRGVATIEGRGATVELRAVNHRFLDLKLRAPVPPALDEAIQQRLRAALERGAVAATVTLERAADAAPRGLDLAAAKAAHAQLVELAFVLGMAGPDLATVLAQPGVIASAAAPPTAELDDATAAAVLAATDAALAQLVTMRRTEGAALAAELTARVDELRAARAAIHALALEVPGELARRLHERLARLLAPHDGVAPDPARLAQEVALLADRADVTEELVRLASHLDQAGALIARSSETKTGGVGRRLDFLVQEIGRELNTIGSKSVRAEISAAIVDAKATLEKLREQVQNVE